jgi:hypothetical protein
VSLVSLFELASIVVATIGGYYILCIAIPGGDLSFQTPPVSMAVVTFNCLGTSRRRRRIIDFDWTNTQSPYVCRDTSQGEYPFQYYFTLTLINNPHRRIRLFSQGSLAGKVVVLLIAVV